jgi:opacity protein-like surface antigen
MSRSDPKRVLPAPSAFVLASLLLVASSALLAPLSPAAAQDLRGWVNGGWALPSDPPEFWELWDGGWSVGGGLGVRVAPEWEFGTSFHVQRFGVDEAAQIDDLLLAGFGQVIPVRALEGRELTMLTLMAELRFHFRPPGARVAPFLSFGTGYFRLDEADATVTPDRPGLDPVIVLGETDSALGATIGAGVEYALGPRVRILLDAIYTVGFTESTSAQYLPIRLGLGIG